MAYSERKHIRLKNRDYSKPGYYFVTVCTKYGLKLLSSVGQGQAPATYVTELTRLGKIAQAQLLGLQDRYPSVSIDKYVIMPNHIHFIVQIREVAGASPRPTLMEIVGTFKSLTTRECNKIRDYSDKQLFQSSFYEHVIRDKTSYFAVCKYIDENPRKWYEGMDQDILQPDFGMLF